MPEIIASAFITLKSVSMDSESLIGWCVQWWECCYRQTQRAFDAIDASDYRTAESEMMLLMLALNNVQRAAGAIGVHASALEEFDSAVPGLKDIRDQVEHFDEYAVGTGRKQRGATLKSHEDIWGISIAGSSTPKNPSASAQFLVSSSSLGPNGEGGQVDLPEALRASLDLTSVALESHGGTLTPMMEDCLLWLVKMGG